MIFRNALFPDQLPCISRLVDVPGKSFFTSEAFLGLARSIAVDLDQDAWLAWRNFSDKRRPGSLISIRKQLKNKSPVMCRRPVVDEDSGRVVISDYSDSQELIVVDLALVFKP